MFYLLIITFAFTASFWTSYRLTHKTELSQQKKIGIFVILFLIWLTPLLIKKSCLVTGATYSLLYHCLYFLYVWAFLFFCLIVIRDIIYGFRKLIKKLKKDQPDLEWKEAKQLNRSNRFWIIVSLILTAYSLYAGLKTPAIKEIKLYSEKIDTSITLVALNDMHLHRALSERKLEKIVNQVNLIRPDAIVFVGDLVDDQSTHLHNQLFILSKLRAPLGKYAVAGNHEYHIGIEQAQEVLREAEINYLQNTGIQMTPNIFLAGVPDSVAASKKLESANIEKAIFDAGENNYKILLAHRPNFIDTLNPKQIDLQISGHTHGGQIFPFHLIVKYVNGYLSGLYETEKGVLYVSRGAGQWGPQMRLFAPSEITVIRLNSIPQNLPTSISNIMKIKDPDTMEEITKTNSDNTQNISDNAQNVAENDTQNKTVLLPFVKKSIKPVGINPFDQKKEQKKEEQKIKVSEKKTEIPIQQKQPEQKEEPYKIDIRKIINHINEQEVSLQGQHATKQSVDPVQKERVQPMNSPKVKKRLLPKKMEPNKASVSSKSKEPKKQVINTNIQGIIEVLETANTDKINQSEQKAKAINQEIDALLAEIRQNEKKEKTKKVEKDVKSVSVPAQKKPVEKQITKTTEPTTPKESVIRQEELFVEVIKKEGVISHIRIYNANHEIIADTSLKDGKNIQKRTTEDADGNIITHETIMHVHNTPEKHITRRTYQVSEGKVVKPSLNNEKPKEQPQSIQQKPVKDTQKQITTNAYSVPTMVPVNAPVITQTRYTGYEVPTYHYQPHSAYSGTYYYAVPQNRIGY